MSVPVVGAPQSWLAYLELHRRQREAEIVAALQAPQAAPFGGGGLTVAKIREIVYQVRPGWPLTGEYPYPSRGWTPSCTVAPKTTSACTCRSSCKRTRRYSPGGWRLAASSVCPSLQLVQSDYIAASVSCSIGAECPCGGHSRIFAATDQWRLVASAL